MYRKFTFNLPETSKFPYVWISSTGIKTFTNLQGEQKLSRLRGLIIAFDKSTGQR